MINKILDLIYPNVCGFCNKLNKNCLCKKCEINIKKYLNEKVIVFLNDKTKYYDYYFYILKYEELIRNKIIDYKFNEKAYLYKTFAKIILKNEKICGILKKYDIIIPVPIHKNRKTIRGYNQSELIAKELGKTLNIPVYDKSLIKVKNNRAQSKLGKNDRKLNVLGAYRLNDDKNIKDKKIILLDDIFTTGNTVNECSKVLKKAKAKDIFVLTIAKD